MTNENKQEQTQKQDCWEGFKSYYAGGQRVIDLTSIDEEYEPVKMRYMDIERKQIYGNKSGSSSL